MNWQELRIAKNKHTHHGLWSAERGGIQIEVQAFEGGGGRHPRSDLGEAGPAEPTQQSRFPHQPTAAYVAIFRIWLFHGGYYT